MPNTPTIATVPVVSAWQSKINWTAGLGFATSLVTAGAAYATGVVPAQFTWVIPLAVQGAQSGLTWLFRTYFNGTVSPSSLPSS